jgi:AcrR family transcriptional regulator
MSLRRAPAQERGQRRVERILDAAAQEFARVGYESATTNGIARRARTSVGSLYQFFANKDEILDALTERYRRQLREFHDRVLGDQAAQLPLPVFYDRLVDGIAEFHSSCPGFRNLFYGSTASAQLEKAARQLHQECTARAEAAIAARMPGLCPARVRLYAAINVEVVKALLPLSESGDEKFRLATLAEIKKLLLRYMSGVDEGVGPGGGESGPEQAS